MISPHEKIEPIVPMGLLAEVLSCQISWKDEGVQVFHPNRGELPVSSSERCPQIPGGFGSGIDQRDGGCQGWNPAKGRWF